VFNYRAAEERNTIDDNLIRRIWQLQQEYRITMELRNGLREEEIKKLKLNLQDSQNIDAGRTSTIIADGFLILLKNQI